MAKRKRKGCRYVLIGMAVLFLLVCVGAGRVAYELFYVDYKYIDEMRALVAEVEAERAARKAEADRTRAKLPPDSLIAPGMDLLKGWPGEFAPPTGEYVENYLEHPDTLDPKLLDDWRAKLADVANFGVAMTPAEVLLDPNRHSAEELLANLRSMLLTHPQLAILEEAVQRGLLHTGQAPGAPNVEEWHVRQQLYAVAQLLLGRSQARLEQGEAAQALDLVLEVDAFLASLPPGPDNWDYTGYARLLLSKADAVLWRVLEVYDPSSEQQVRLTAHGAWRRDGAPVQRLVLYATATTVLTYNFNQSWQSRFRDISRTYGLYSVARIEAERMLLTPAQRLGMQLSSPSEAALRLPGEMFFAHYMAEELNMVSDAHWLLSMSADALETALALKAYKRDRGEYPDTLDPLIPSYLAAAPLNPFMEAPMAYAREGGGFVLNGPPGDAFTGRMWQHWIREDMLPWRLGN